MQYHHAPRQDHSDLASGAVLHSRPGQPAFPVRLARELFARAQHHRRPSHPVTVWDPCCGSAQLLVTLGLTERRHLNGLVGSDTADEALALAAKNAPLVTMRGLVARSDELRAAAHRHGRQSHTEAAQASLRLARTLDQDGGDLPIELHRANALDPTDVEQVAARAQPDIVIADLPHGRMTSWVSPTGEPDPQAKFANTIASILPGNAIIVLISRSRGSPLPPGTRALDRLRAGHRSAAITPAGWLKP